MAIGQVLDKDREKLMPYVTRDAVGRIAAIYGEPLEGTEEMAADNVELREFVSQGDSEAMARWQFMESDMALVRVFEDLVEVLMDKGIILATDPPAPAQRKLAARRGLRKEFTYVETLFGGDEETSEDFDADASEDGFL